MRASTEADDVVTRGHLLDGRVRYDQLASGHRSGIEPVFLAAAIPARPGHWVLEAGTGAGAALLCLAARVPGVIGRGVEIDAALCAVARDNFAALDAARLSVVQADVRTFATGRDGAFDHAMANPPWHDGAGTASPDFSRERARRAAPGLLEAWITALAGAVRPRGTVTLIAAVSVVPDFLGALAHAGLGSPSLLPLWPSRARPAKLVVMRATRGGRAPLSVLPGLILHEPHGGFTDAADAILRGGAALPLAAARSRHHPR